MGSETLGLQMYVNYMENTGEVTVLQKMMMWSWWTTGQKQVKTVKLLEKFQIMH